MNPFAMFFFDIAAVAERAKTIRRKYSAGPNRIAKRATGMAVKIITTVAIIPPIKEAIAEIARAASARPCIAIGYPSNVDAIAAPSPGVFIKIEERLPPNMAP
jgi:ABC-type xylose transport system permease subunit